MILATKLSFTVHRKKATWIEMSRVDWIHIAWNPSGTDLLQYSLFLFIDYGDTGSWRFEWSY